MPIFTPDLVTTIAQQVSRQQPAPRSPLDLRAFQTELLKRQILARRFTQDRFSRQAQKNRHALRVRCRAASDLKVVDTQADRRGTLYYELENGQVISANRLLATRLSGRYGNDRAVATLLSPRFHKKSWNRLFKPRNALLVQLARTETEKNANRKAVA